MQKGVDNLLDAYQEGLLTLEHLRTRVPQLQKRFKTIEGELQHLEALTIDRDHSQQMALNMENFIHQFHYEEVKAVCFAWLNRRNQRRSYRWGTFKRLLPPIPLARPRITELTRLHRTAC